MITKNLIILITIILLFYIIIYFTKNTETFKTILPRKRSIGPTWQCPKGFSQEYVKTKPSIRGNTIKYGSGPTLVPAPSGGVCQENCKSGFITDRNPTSEPRDKCWYNCNLQDGYFNNGSECRKFAQKDPKTGKITRGHSFPRPFYYRKYTFPQPLCSDGYNRNTLNVTNPQWYNDYIKKLYGVVRSWSGDSVCLQKCPNGYIGLRNGCLQK